MNTKWEILDNWGKQTEEEVELNQINTGSIVDLWLIKTEIKQPVKIYA